MLSRFGIHDVRPSLLPLPILNADVSLLPTGATAQLLPRNVLMSLSATLSMLVIYLGHDLSPTERRWPSTTVTSSPQLLHLRTIPRRCERSLNITPGSGLTTSNS